MNKLEVGCIKFTAQSHNLTAHILVDKQAVSLFRSGGHLNFAPTAHCKVSSIPMPHG